MITHKTDKELKECFENLYLAQTNGIMAEYSEIPNYVKTACMEFAEMGFISGYNFARRLAETNKKLSEI